VSQDGRRTEIVDDSGIWLATLPPTLRQRRLALMVAVVLVAAFGVTLPLAATPLPRLDAFIPSLDATICVTDLITAIMLFGQFSIYRSRALLALANGFLFTALIVIPHALTFPDAFSTTGLLGGGLQSTVWLYVFWHFGFPIALVAYVLLKDTDRTNGVMRGSTQSGIATSVAIILILVCALAWVATAGDRFLPRVFPDTSRFSPLLSYVFAFNVAIGVLALALMWIRRRSVLDQWLMIAASALIMEQVFGGPLGSARFSLGFYAGRLFSLVTSIVVLVVLLTETTRLFARLARANTMLQRERSNKLMSLEVVAASIAHEVRQPLAAIATNGSAALRFLGKSPPNLAEAQSALNRIVDESHRASQVFDSIRSLFRRTDQGQQAIDVNEIAAGVLLILRAELTEHGIASRVELTSDLPLVMGHRGQLREVILNLVRNAIEAMQSMESGSRVLRVRTEPHGRDAIVVAVEDSGPGIAPEKLNGIFDAFVTTKPQGMGLGLALCRMIIERHEGRLTASSGETSGAVFQFILPVKTSSGSIPAPI
jgi:signal transduction histidine kinase